MDLKVLRSPGKGQVCSYLALALGLIGITARLSAQQPSTANGEWPHYTADLKGTKYSPRESDQRVELQQARSRVAVQDRQLRHASRIQARRHAADGQGRDLRDGRYAAGRDRSRRQYGRDCWIYSLREGKRAAIAPRQLSGRGLSYWTDGKGDDRIVFVPPAIA